MYSNIVANVNSKHLVRNGFHQGVRCTGSSQRTLAKYNSATGDHVLAEQARGEYAEGD